MSFPHKSWYRYLKKRLFIDHFRLNSMHNISVHYPFLELIVFEIASLF